MPATSDPTPIGRRRLLASTVTSGREIERRMPCRWSPATYPSGRPLATSRPCHQFPVEPLREAVGRGCTVRSILRRHPTGGRRGPLCGFPVPTAYSERPHALVWATVHRLEL